MSNLNYDELLALIDRLEDSSIEYLDYSSNNGNIVLAKSVPTFKSHISEKEITEQAVTPSARIEERKEKTTSEAQTKLDNIEEVKAPMIGVMYLQADPDSKPYVQVGDYITQGSVVCIIEAMKLMNEIQAPVSGVVTEILVDNESVVEYNQPMIRIQVEEDNA